MNDFIKADKIIENSRLDNEKKLFKKQEEIYKTIPEYKILTEKIKLLNLSLINTIRNKDEETEKKIREEIKLFKNKRIELLKEKNYDSNYLEMKYNCQICKDTGEIKGSICKCKKNIVNKLRLNRAKMYQAVEEETFKNFDFSIFRDTKKENEQLSPRELMELYFDEFKEYAENFSTKSDSLFISGNVGVGKTYLCNSISTEVINKGFNVVYMTSLNLMQQLRLNVYDSFDKAEENQQKYQLLIDADLLIIDDLGTESISDLTVAAFFNLINNRMMVKKPTIISTNIPLNEISRVYDERISSRIKTFKFHPIMGDDLRLRKKDEQ